MTNWCLCACPPSPGTQTGTQTYRCPLPRRHQSPLSAVRLVTTRQQYQPATTSCIGHLGSQHRSSRVASAVTASHCCLTTAHRLIRHAFRPSPRATRRPADAARQPAHCDADRTTRAQRTAPTLRRFSPNPCATCVSGAQLPRHVRSVCVTRRGAALSGAGDPLSTGADPSA